VILSEGKHTKNERNEIKSLPISQTRIRKQKYPFQNTERSRIDRTGKPAQNRWDIDLRKHSTSSTKTMLRLSRVGLPLVRARRLIANQPVWEDGSARALPQISADLTADVCVVGLGGSGLSCVKELHARGLNVVGIDAGTVAGRAAGRNGGFLLAGVSKFHHDSGVAMGRKQARTIYELTLQEMERMTSETPDCIHDTGSLRIASSTEEVGDCERQLAIMLEDDLPAQRYQGPEGTGLLFPRDGSFNPLRRCRQLASGLISNGVQLFEHSPAMHIERGLVRCPGGNIHAGTVIVCVDGGILSLLPELRSRVRSVRLQMLATAPLPTVIFTRPVYARWGTEYWQQLPDRSLALGGFRDAGGDAERTDVAQPSDIVQSHLEKFLRQSLGVQAPVTHRWASTVSYSDSALPLLEEVRDGVWACGVYNGTGNVIGSLCGRALAQRVAGDRRLFDSLRPE
jgi:glycine/D-amino acid oxidase-like deaminating enzyme